MPDEEPSRLATAARVATAVALFAALVAAVVLVALAIGQGHNTLAVKLVQWALEAAVVAVGLAILGAVTWGDS